MENVRKINANVDIYYGNEETSEIKSTSATQINTPTDLNGIYRSTNHLKFKPFTLEGSFSLGENRAIIDKFGWWGTVLSSEIAQGENIYPFPDNDLPCLVMEFAGSRIIRKIDVFGDSGLDEFPSRFKLTMYDDNLSVVYCKTFSNQQACSQILLQEDGSYLADDNKRLIKVRSIKLTLLAWNKPKRLSKIYRFYDDIMETYKFEDIKEFEVTHEKVNNGTIKYGLCSDSCTVSLYNKDRKFDRGYLRNMIHLNKLIVPHVDSKSLGFFYIKEWSFSQDGMFVKCSANDRLLDFQTINYPGRMPYRATDIVDTSEWSVEDTESLRVEQATQKVTFYQLFKEVLEYAAASAYMKKFEYTIAPALKDYTVTPFIRKDTVWTVLQKLCDATLSHIYINENDVLIVETTLPAKSPAPPVLLRSVNRYSISGLEVDDTPMPMLSATAESKDDELIKINTSNAFAMDVPYFADMVANEVDIAYFTRKLEDIKESLASLSEIKIPAGNIITKVISIDDIYDEVHLKFANISDIDNCEIHFAYNKGCTFIISVRNLSNLDKLISEISVFGKKIDFTKVSLPKEYVNTDPLAFRYPYAHPDSELIQNEEYARELKQYIIAQHPEDTKCATVQWRGDLKLNLNRDFELENRFKDKELYNCTYSKITIQGGMRQETKGVLKNNAKVV